MKTKLLKWIHDPAVWLIFCAVAVEFWGVALCVILDGVQADFAAMREELEAMDERMTRIGAELDAILADVESAATGGVR